MELKKPKAFVVAASIVDFYFWKQIILQDLIFKLQMKWKLNLEHKVTSIAILYTSCLVNFEIFLFLNNWKCHWHKKGRNKIIVFATLVKCIYRVNRRMQKKTYKI